MLGPFPLERLTLRIKDGVGRLPCLGPQLLNEVRDPLGDRGHRGQDGLGPLFSPLAEHGE